VNGAYRGEDEIGRLMHDFSCADPEDMLDKDFAKATGLSLEEVQKLAIIDIASFLFSSGKEKKNWRRTDTRKYHPSPIFCSWGV
jgi:hypothetical protein